MDKLSFLLLLPIISIVILIPFYPASFDTIIFSINKVFHMSFKLFYLAAFKN